MENFGINWYTPSTDDTLKRAMPGEVLRLSAWTGRTIDLWQHVRVTSEPEARTTWHGYVDRSIFSRRVWLEFQLVFGELVFNHAKGAFPRPEPIWETFPESRPTRPTVPAAVAYRFEEGHHIPVACIWLGEPGQNSDEFRREVLAALPQPLTIEERFALRGNQPVTVLVAAEPSDERDELMRHLSGQPNDRIVVRTADTAEETLANLGSVDVVIVADQLPQHAGEKSEGTYCIGFIRNELVPRKMPLVGWAVNAQRQHEIDYRSAGLDHIMMHLRADCGRVLNGNPEPGRSIANLILDALGVPSTHKE